MRYTTEAILICSLLTGCSFMERARTDIQPTETQTYEHINELAQGSPSAANADVLVDTAGRFRTKLRMASSSTATPEQIKSYLDTGIAVVNLYCREFFKQISVSAAHRGYLRSEVNDIGGFLSAVLGLADAGSTATGGAGALFSLLDSSVENYDASYMVSPDLPTIERLVIRSQATLANALLASGREYSYPQAERALADYANTCTFNGIKSLANESVNAAKVGIGSDGSTLKIVRPGESVESVKVPVGSDGAPKGTDKSK